MTGRSYVVRAALSLVSLCLLTVVPMHGARQASVADERADRRGRSALEHPVPPLPVAGTSIAMLDRVGKVRAQHAPSRPAGFSKTIDTADEASCEAPDLSSRVTVVDLAVALSPRPRAPTVTAFCLTDLVVHLPSRELRPSVAPRPPPASF